MSGRAVLNDIEYMDVTTEEQALHASNIAAPGMHYFNASPKPPIFAVHPSNITLTTASKIGRL